MAGCVASACKSGHRALPVVRDIAEGLGPEGLPSGIRPSALCRRPTADHVPTMCRTFALKPRCQGGKRVRVHFSDFCDFLSISPRSQKNERFLEGAHSRQHPRHHLHHPHPWQTLMRMMPVMRVMLSPKSGHVCRKRGKHSVFQGFWRAQTWKPCVPGMRPRRKVSKFRCLLAASKAAASRQTWKGKRGGPLQR